VSGTSRGPTAGPVRVIVYSDRGYVQDGSDVPDRSGAWRIPGCIFGRSGSIDSGGRFRIQATAPRPDGTTARSAVITVRRR
jgi:hypothetical protein